MSRIGYLLRPRGERGQRAAVTGRAHHDQGPKLEHHRGTPSDVAEILKKPISQEMLGGHAMLEDPVVVQGTVALHLRYPLRR